jgi:hypothetical protein
LPRREQLEQRALLTTLFVDDDAAPGGDGLAWESAYDDLQLALAAAVAGDEIWVASGTYQPTSGSDRAVSFNLKSGVSLYGGFAGTETELSQRDWVENVTTLSGDIGNAGDNTDNSYHVLYATDVDTSSVFDGFSVTGGYANAAGPNYYGGGIYNVNSSPTLTNVSFNGNYAAETRWRHL